MTFAGEWLEKVKKIKEQRVGETSTVREKSK